MLPSTPGAMWPEPLSVAAANAIGRARAGDLTLPWATFSDPEVAAAMRFILAHFRRGISVDDVAAQAHVSRRHLQDRFLNKTGRTIVEMITLQRDCTAAARKSMTAAGNAPWRSRSSS